jgi:drug/metabolite transporter (DMT)-like permease
MIPRARIAWSAASPPAVQHSNRSYVSEAVSRGGLGVQGAAFNAELPLMLVTPALFAANLVVARWAESAAIPPVFLAFGRWALAFHPAAFVGPRLWALRATLHARTGRACCCCPRWAWAWRSARNTSARATPAPPTSPSSFAACPALVMLLETLVWKAPLGGARPGGMLLAVAGVLVVLSKGDLAALGQLAFGRGDLWVVLAASAGRCTRCWASACRCRRCRARSSWRP